MDGISVGLFDGKLLGVVVGVFVGFFKEFEWVVLMALLLDNLVILLVFGMEKLLVLMLGLQLGLVLVIELEKR